MTAASTGRSTLASNRSLRHKAAMITKCGWQDIIKHLKYVLHFQPHLRAALMHFLPQDEAEHSARSRGCAACSLYLCLMAPGSGAVPAYMSACLHLCLQILPVRGKHGLWPLSYVFRP